MGYGRSIEVTLEREGLVKEDYYYSVRLHCTEQEYENGDYHAGVGIINSVASASTNVDEIKNLLVVTLNCNERYPVVVHTQSDNVHQTLADKIAKADVKREANQHDAEESLLNHNIERS